MHEYDAIPPFQMSLLMLAESWMFWLLVLVFIFLLLLNMTFRLGTHQRQALPLRLRGLFLPELRLLRLALPLELLWEIAQFPLYDVWRQGTWTYILYSLAHCTLGDLLILLITYELIALIAGGRNWYRSAPITGSLLFTLLGVSYTILSETINERINGAWGYTDLMPIVPLVNIGAMPFLQWVLIPFVLVWLMRQLPDGRIPTTNT